jgi:hypothetical protein
MSSITSQPDAAAAAAAHLTGRVSAMNTKNAAAAAATIGVVPAAAEPVSALMAAQFAVHAQMYQVLSAQAAAFHQQFISTLTASSASDGATEGTDAAAGL